MDTLKKSPRIKRKRKSCQRQFVFTVKDSALFYSTINKLLSLTVNTYYVVPLIYQKYSAMHFVKLESHVFVRASAGVG
jgi:hypothetical protein